MTCVHLRQLYQLCQQQELRLSSTDLVRIVCQQCGEQEVCPATLMGDDDEAGPCPEATSDGNAPETSA